MSQGYHTSATTNMHSREIIQQSSLSHAEPKTIGSCLAINHIIC